MRQNQPAHVKRQLSLSVSELRSMLNTAIEMQTALEKDSPLDYDHADEEDGICRLPNP